MRIHPISLALRFLKGERTIRGRRVFKRKVEAVQVLREFTGQNFGTDAKLWSEWLRKNRRAYKQSFRAETRKRSFRVRLQKGKESDVVKCIPIGNTPALRPLVDAVLAEAREIVEHRWEELGYNARGIKGKINSIWKNTARILKERHGIEWWNPMQMRPGLFAD